MRLWRPDPHHHRRATWMELFFDLIFVAAVAEVGKPLAADFTPAGLLRYSFLFVLIWWAWTGFTLYSTRFDSDDVVQRALILVQSFIAAVMAANAKDALDSRSSAGFGAAYAGMRFILVLQYLRALRIPETRPMAARFAAGFGIAACLWIVSALTEPPVRYWLWSAALLIDFLTPWLAERHGRSAPPDAVHFPERFGLFSIILMGEFIAEVMRGIESQEYWSFSAAATAFSGMAFAFLLRWWYFDRANAATERHIRNNRQARLFHLWKYAHLPLFLAIGVAGVGFHHLISLQADERMHPGHSTLFFLAAATLIAALTTLGATSGKARLGRMLPQYLAAVIVAAAGPFAESWNKVAIALFLLGACSIPPLQKVDQPVLE
ncbi:MAG: low temperature requirement protein A [Bryobacteraceae bacterium]